MNRHADSLGNVTVEFLGVPRLRAGRQELSVPPGKLADVLAAVEQSCPGLKGFVGADGRLAPQYLLSLDGRNFLHDLNGSVQAGERLLLLSADAGG